MYKVTGRISDFSEKIVLELLFPFLVKQLRPWRWVTDIEGIDPSQRPLLFSADIPHTVLSIIKDVAIKFYQLHLTSYAEYV